MSNKSDDFSLTFTINPELYKFCPNVQYRYTSDTLYRILNCLPADTYLRCTEETKFGNIHYHVYIQFPQVLTVKKVRNMIQKLIKDEPMFGFFDIRTTYDQQNWLAYMHKAPFIQHRDCHDDQCVIRLEEQYQGA